MSTRSTTHFREGEKLVAIVYRHLDGYPSRTGKDLLKFFKEVRDNVTDTRFDDASYLAAKWCVYLGRKFATNHTSPTHYLDFVSVGILQADPPNIEYRYIVDCRQRDSEGYPVVTCEVGIESSRPLRLAIAEDEALVARLMRKEFTRWLRQAPSRTEEEKAWLKARRGG